MARRNYLITYDISDDKRRNHVFSALMDNGDHVQFSVFLCELNLQELAMLKVRLSEAIHQRADQIIILDLGDVERPLDRIVECVGRKYDPPCRVQVV